MSTWQTSPPIEALLSQAEAALQRGDWEQARAACQAVLEAEPLNRRGRELLGRVGAGMQGPEGARRNMWRRSWRLGVALFTGRVAKRFLFMIVVIWAASTVMFIVPRVWGFNPSRAGIFTSAKPRPAQQADENRRRRPQSAYDREFGLDDPQVIQYFRYIRRLATFDLGTSRRYFPVTVNQVVRESLWWTLGLVGVSTLLAFALGTVVGALMGWPDAPGPFRYLFTPLLGVSAVPYYLMGWILIWFMAFKWGWFPLAGGYDVGSQPGWTPGFALDALHHAFLPGLSILLSTVGLWAVNMRGVMVSLQGEDYMLQSAAKGLKRGRRFFYYGVRNALLPQVTGLSVTVGSLFTGVLLVEIVFRYPGVGFVLFQAVRQRDIFMITGLVYVVIVLLAIATFVIDIAYPLIDPRINEGRR